MRDIRLQFMLHIYNWSSKIYASCFKMNKEAWHITKEDFLRYPIDSLGYAMGEFYRSKGFEVMPKLENHDVFHVLTETDTEIENEIAMQYLLLGNGKVSLYLVGMILIGTVVFPEFLNYYIDAYKKGKGMTSFHAIEFKAYLGESLSLLQATFKQNQEIINIK